MKWLWSLLFLVLAGCEAQTNQERLGFASKTPSRMVVTNKVRTFAHGQKMEYVVYEDMDRWLTAHENKIRIECFAPDDRAGHGYTTGYLIVYTEQ